MIVWPCATSRATCASRATRRGRGSCCPPQPWAFRSDSQREQLLFGMGDALTWLAGHRLHLRVTSRPYPTADWASGLHRPDAESARRRPGVDAVGASTWSTLQKHLRHQTMAEKEVFLGVRVCEPIRQPPTDLRPSGGTRATSSTPGCCPRSSGSRRAVGPARARRTAGHVAREMEWLLRRSVGIGLPAPSRPVAGGSGVVGTRGPRTRFADNGRVRRGSPRAGPCR